MLTVQQVNQYYGGSHTLRGVSMSVQTGQCTALLAAMAWARPRC